MIKVCHLTSVHKENDTRIFFKECVSLAQNGYEVSLVVAGAKDKIENQVKIYGVQKITNRFQRILFSGKPILKKAFEINADIYHFHDSELLSVGIKLRQKGKIVIYDSHEDLPRQILTKPWIPKCCRKIVSKMVEIVENRRVSKMSAVVTATSHIQERFQKVTNKPVVTVCNYPIIHEITSTSSWENKEKSACYIGGIFYERGIYEMINAIGKTEARLKLAGSFSPENLIDDLKKETHWKQVDYLGFLNRIQINDLLASSMVGLLILHPMPSYKDSLPIKMFEYMAAGIPVICSDFELWKNIIEPSNCGVCINPFDTSKIADEITHFIQNPDKAKQMGENGRKAVEEQYNWQTQEKILLQLYKDIQ